MCCDQHSQAVESQLVESLKIKQNKLKQSKKNQRICYQQKIKARVDFYIKTLVGLTRMK